MNPAEWMFYENIKPNTSRCDALSPESSSMTNF